MRVNIYNPANNRAKSFKWGFSWTNFLFGWISLLLKGMWMMLLLDFVACILINTLSKGSAVMGWLVGLVYCIFLGAFGNKFYVNYLLSKGWQPADEASSRVLGR